jgi:molybdenum cofactor cytidylyltransferase
MISGLVLAAGVSKRMGSPKQELKLAGKAMLDHVTDSFLSSGLAEVVVVIRPGISWSRKARRLKVVVNPRPSEGISESLKVGVRALNKRSEAVVVGLGDKPLVRPSTIDMLVSAYESSDSKMVVPTLKGTRGNPVLFDKSLLPELLRLRGDAGAKSIMEDNPRGVLEVPVDDEGVIVDVNTPADKEKVERILARRKSSARV